MLPIGAFSKISNVTTNTLRYYDEIGLLKPVYVNVDSGYRYYDDSQLKTMLLINKLKTYGFSLEEIIDMLRAHDGGPALLNLVKAKRDQMTQTIESYKLVLSQLNRDISNLERGISIMSYMDDIEVKLAKTEDRNILSIREKINVNDYGKYMGMLMERIYSGRFTTVGAPFSIYHSEEYTPDNYDTEIAVPVAEVTSDTYTLPGCECAMVTLKGPYSQLTSVYAKLNQWIDESGYQLSGPPMEVYLTNPGMTSPDDYLTEVYLPVKRI